MNCKTCKYARKAINKDAVACAYWSLTDNSPLVNHNAGYYGSVYEGWAYINTGYYDGPAEKHGMMTNFCTLLKTEEASGCDKHSQLVSDNWNYYDKYWSY